jgi:tyrosine-protein phosphatase SIW14
MTRLSLLLSFAVVLLVAGLPFVYARQRHETYRNFRVVEEGVLYRSGQMSPAGFERICREKGIRTVVTLREASDDPADQERVEAEEQFCRDNGIRWEPFEPKSWDIPPGGTEAPIAANIRAFERLLADPQRCPRPVLVHCFAGIHRTGTHVAAYRMAFQGWTNAEAWAELLASGKRTSTYGESLKQFVLGYRPVADGRAGE